LGVNYDLSEQISFKLSYAYQNTRLTSGGNLPGEDIQTIALQTDYIDPDHNLKGNAVLSYYDQQPDVLNPAGFLPAHWLVDLNAVYAWSGELKLTAGIKNLFNTIYYQRSDFRAPGLGLELGGEITF
jgi:outer membrane receptor protein involved in Fe transport